MGTNETLPPSRHQKHLHRQWHSLRYQSPVDGLLFLCRPSRVNPSSIGGSWNVSNLYKMTHALTNSSRSDNKTKIFLKKYHDGWNEDTVLLSQTEIWMQRYCRLPSKITWLWLKIYRLSTVMLLLLTFPKTPNKLLLRCTNSSCTAADTRTQIWEQRCADPRSALRAVCAPKPNKK